jgi:hypothetical protein
MFEQDNVSKAEHGVYTSLTLLACADLRGCRDTGEHVRTCAPYVSSYSLHVQTVKSCKALTAHGLYKLYSLVLTPNL